MSSLLLIGFALVSVPLLLAVFNAATKVRALSGQSAELVRTGVESTQHSQLLFQQIASMERSARQYQVLGDPALLDVYRETRGRFLETLARLSAVPEGAGRAPYIDRMRSTLSAIDAKLFLSAAPAAPGATAPSAAPARPETNGEFTALAEQAAALADYTSRQIDSGLSQLQAAMDETRNLLYWQSAGTLVVTALLVLLFTIVLMRPIREIDAAISQLGKGTFAQPVEVHGPSDLEALGRQLEWLRQRLLELAQERNRFLRHMSHELKTPLANIREGTELLMEGAVGELGTEQREVASILRENGLRLQQLIENLLSFSAWQARNSQLDISQFGLRRLVKSVLESQQLTLLAQRMRLDLVVDDVSLRADRAKLRLILDNLVSNAIKFTPREGTIYLHARAHEDELVLDVADTGPGIAVTEREKIFQAFYSGSTPQSGHVKGTGIGLSIVSDFVQAHGGTIELVDGQFS
ncbi:MAG TPA: ATP-binding protein, partial [Steroidobacteraceae bacterium]|nr:ATP-binding protein [Steroidobacteraceae bacterium]